MDIDEFLDEETKEVFEEKDDSKKLEGLKIDNPDILDEVKKYLKQNDYFNKVKLALGRNDFNTAEKLYYELWAKLGDNVVWNQKIHDTLIKICGEINKTLNGIYSDISKKRDIANELINKAKGNLAQGNYQVALSQYSELIDYHKDIPHFLFEEKRTMHNDILNLYMELKEKIDSVFLNKFNTSLDQIKHMIGQARANLNKMYMENAKNIYLDIIDIYTNLPAGFLSEKTSIAKDILELYREISINIEIKNLENQLKMEKSVQKQPMVRPVPKAREAVHKKEIERLRAMSYNKKITLKIPRHIPLKKLSKIPSVDKGGELKKMLIKRRLDRAKLKLDKGHFKEARKEFDSVLRLDANNSEAKVMLDKIQK